MKKTSKTDWQRLEKMDDKEIDFSDIPKLDDMFFRNAEWRDPKARPRVTDPDDKETT